MFEWSKNLIEIQVDLTSHCNAKCGACIRNINGGEVNPFLKLNHFNIDVWTRLATVDTKNKLISKLILNGNWGDAMMHPDILKMIDIWTDAHPETFINIATNGSMRSTEFWKEFAGVISKNEHQLEFAVDGLEDTHSIYRRNTDFNKVIANITAFVEGGGYAVPIITVFDHNIHQIEDIKQLLKNIGAGGCFVRASHDSNIHIKTDTEDFYITAPSQNTVNELAVHDMIEWKHSISKHRDKDLLDTLRNQLSDEYASDTLCPWYNRARIQIDPWHQVWPCCHISVIAENKESKQYKQIANDIDNNLSTKSLDEILGNIWFSKDIPNSLYNKDLTWNICTKSCGVGEG